MSPLRPCSGSHPRAKQKPLSAHGAFLVCAGRPTSSLLLSPHPCSHVRLPGATPCLEVPSTLSCSLSPPLLWQASPYPLPRPACLPFNLLYFVSQRLQLYLTLTRLQACNLITRLLGFFLFCSQDICSVKTGIFVLYHDARHTVGVPYLLNVESINKISQAELWWELKRYCKTTKGDFSGC